MISLIFFSGTALLIAGYFVYGRFISGRARLDDANPCPSKTEYDGVDFAPTNKFVLLGHHFSSIAGAGPIVGPIIGAAVFGWGPAFAWIVLGSIFMGGVHDFMSLVISIRNRGRSIAEVARNHLTPITYRMILIFIWFALVYVILVFTDLTKSTFINTVTIGNEVVGKGSVATATLLLIALALLFGQLRRLSGWHIGKLTLPFLALIIGVVFLGIFYPLDVTAFGVGNEALFWLIVLIVYALAASVTPVTVLLQPRDYLSSFLLYTMLLLGSLGLIFGIGSLSLQHSVFQNFFITYTAGPLSAAPGGLFPILFITIACGAFSGFHSLVASGTSSKQIEKESDALRIGYGSMILEGILALLALTAVVFIMDRGEGYKNPVLLFSRGMGNFMNTIGIPPRFGVLFAQLAVSTFLLTTLDTSTRIARYVFAEFFDRAGDLRFRYLATVATLILPIVLLILPHFETFSFLRLTAGGKPIPIWKAIWPIFGATNQLLGAVAMIVITVWMKKEGRRYLFTLLPMIFMSVVTLWALVLLIRTNLLSPLLRAATLPVSNLIIGVISLLLFTLALIILFDGVRFLLKKHAEV